MAKGELVEVALALLLLRVGVGVASVEDDFAALPDVEPVLMLPAKLAIEDEVSMLDDESEPDEQLRSV